MTVTNLRPEVIPPTAAEPIQSPEPEFDWRQCWYPVAFVQDLPKNRPISFSLYDEPLVLFANEDGKLECLSDRCPHRAAKLSDGQVIDGKLECLYHGWQFGAEGKCLHIPQLPENAKIPANASVRSFKVVEKQGIVWMWAGEPEAAEEPGIPIIEDLDKPEFVSADVMIDLPYDQNYFIENVLDPAHVNISHHPTQGNRKNAQPLEMEIIANSARGIRGRLRGTRKQNEKWTEVDFIAPNFVIYKFNFEDRGWFGGLALYSIPSGKGGCRLLARNYRNFLTWKIKLTPRWLDHWYRNRILEEDLVLIVGEQEQIERLGENIKSLYLPLKSCDVFTVAYRKWLDEHGSNLPFYQGYATSKSSEHNQKRDLPPVSMARFEQHTKICSSCSSAYRTTIRAKQILVGAAIALGALAILADSLSMQLAVVSAFLSASLSAVALAVVAEKVKTKFERSYSRH